MTTSPERGSAKIYQFPLRGRPAAGERREDAKSSPDKSPADIATLHPTSQRIANAVFGSAWYHDEAIQAERAGTT